MIKEQVYELEDGKEYVQIECIMYNDKYYLLLNEKETENVIVAIEENNQLTYVDPEEENYREIIDLLYYKLSGQIRNNLNVDK